MEKYDVIVVGAGFGGPVAAKKCAEAGLHTLIVERGQRPGEKVVSGTYVPLFGAPEWIREGNPPLERAAYGWRYHFIKGGEIYLSIDVSFPFPISHGMYCRPMCTWLAEQAVKAAQAIKPKLAIPMHYGAIVGDEKDAMAFKKALEGDVEVLVLSKS